jgi:hypothetical protein
MMAAIRASYANENSADALADLVDFGFALRTRIGTLQRPVKLLFINRPLRL